MAHRHISRYILYLHAIAERHSHFNSSTLMCRPEPGQLAHLLLRLPAAAKTHGARARAAPRGTGGGSSVPIPATWRPGRASFRYGPDQVGGDVPELNISIIGYLAEDVERFPVPAAALGHDDPDRLVDDGP